tara:strand:+ start:604 stop:1185 length:582 start_codon:yes stop_codon:yes gene_type:complete
MKRATSSIRVDDDLVLRPATKLRSDDIVEAFEETWPEVNRAMPWINPDNNLSNQMSEFLSETERMGRAGLLHHWVMIRPWDNSILGLIGFDRVTRSGQADWNLGYWVRSSEQNHGIASKSIEAVLRWMGEIEEVSIELKVDPLNIPGKSTVAKIVNKWSGRRCIEGDSSITVAGARTVHECHVVTVGPKGPVN